MPVKLDLLGLAIKRAQDRDHRAMDSALRAIGVTLVQWDALRAIDAAPAASAHDLAVTTFQSDQAFGTLGTRLVAAGWVERSPGVGRRLEHRLTDAGRSMLADGRAVTARVLPELFAPLVETERAVLLELLARLTGGASRP
ncbi:DNA-binding MarR family transcriptional regulator [Frondihabitans sp. PhB188]|uniref:MarR family winged helix-turn-helix transcriptional regulator n=1 Tax=Frondihabitans sp. PhB188 TaxID=2485200 RepID=UPI000F47EB58|nr:MarR family winged helix-turn-helix transcriptional regulator [Frondihabitans sp. PhB188]ROQ36522.1 DNA-binding MarR family transcriptional regulator [Frondihabitans sp. PhB188]